jgi:hypothetical protein
MIRHAVLITFRATTTEEQIDALTSKLNRIRELVPAIRSAASGRDLAVTAGSSDFSICLDFDSLDDFKAYLAHDEHVAVVDLLRDCVDSRTVVDFSFD